MPTGERPLCLRVRNSIRECVRSCISQFNFRRYELVLRGKDSEILFICCSQLKSVAGPAEKEMTVTISDMQQDAVYPNSGDRKPLLGKE